MIQSHTRGRLTESSADERQAIDDFVSRLSRAFASRGVSAQVAEAGIVVSIEVDGLPRTHAHLLLDRVPCVARVGPAPGRPDVRLRLPLRALSVFWDDGSHLALRTLSGEIRFEGTVRKLLRVMPILRDAVKRTADPQILRHSSLVGGSYFPLAGDREGIGPHLGSREGAQTSYRARPQVGEGRCS
jgi:hypothetical protein